MAAELSPGVVLTPSDESSLKAVWVLMSAGTVHRHLEGGANVTHSIIGEPTEAADQDGN